MLMFVVLAVKAMAVLPTITSFTPGSGAVGTLVTITGTNLGSPTAFTIGGTSALVITNTGTQLVGFVMPGAVTGVISVTTSGGTATSAGNFTVITTRFPSVQQGSTLVGTGITGGAQQGTSVAVSADGNTAIVGGSYDNSYQGAVWVFTRSGSTWSPQGGKLVGTGNIGAAYQGSSVAISADGNTAIVGGPFDNSSMGAVWVFTRSGSTWSQQGNKLVGTSAIGNANQGHSVSLSADGNTAIVGGYGDNADQGAVWVYTRSAGTWSQQGSKLVGTGAIGYASQGSSVSLSADGNAAIVGGNTDNSMKGAAWIWTRSGNSWSQQGSKLVGTGVSGNQQGQGRSVSLSADGNTAIWGGNIASSGIGAAWVFTRSAGIWTQQGSQLVGTGAIGTASQGSSVSLSADGNTAIVGGPDDYYNSVYDPNIEDYISGYAGATWVFTRSAGIWTQQGSKLVGTGDYSDGAQGYSVSLSADGSTAIVGGYYYNQSQGAAWVFIPASCVSPAISSQSTATQTQPVGGTYSAISVTATGTGITYQWYSNATASNSAGTSLGSANGAQTNSYTPQSATAGTLYYYCVVTGTCGTATSAVSGVFITTAASPTITSFTPTTGSLGTLVTITGTNFTGATAVSFGGTAATSFSVVISTSITAVVAGGTTGTISVVTPAGTATSVGTFTYLAPIQVYNGAVLQASYQTLKAAFDAINAGTHQGAITVMINQSTTETAAAVLNASSSPSSYISVNIYPTVTGLSVSGNLNSPLIDLNGATNVTIDGRVNATGSAKDLVITNTSISAAAETSTIRFINDASSNNVKYCTIKGSSTAAYGGVIWFSTTTGTSGNDNNIIDHNDITNAADANRPINGIASTGTSAKENSGNTISNNNIYDFLNRGTISYGINLWNNNSTWSVTGNSFYETTSFVPAASVAYYGINIYYAPGTGFIVNNNSIGGKSSGCGGTAWTKTAAFDNAFTAINLNVGTGTITSVQGNTIRNFDFANSANASWYGIYVIAGAVNIGTVTANTIGAATGNGSVTVTNTSSGGCFYGINIAGTGSTNTQNNIIGAITAGNTAAANATNFYGIKTASSGATAISNNTIGSTDAGTSNSINASCAASGNAQTVYGIYSSGSGTVSVSGNTISKLTNGTTNATAGTAGLINGITTTSGTNTISNNTVRNLTIANANTAGDYLASVTGIALNYTTAAAQSIAGNTIYNLSNTSASFAGNVIGLYYNGSTMASAVSGNFINSLSATSANAVIYGIKIDGGTATYSNNIIGLGTGITNGNTIYGIELNAIGSNAIYLYYNTVDIEGSVAGVTGNTYALSNNGYNTRNYRNNIFNNSRSGGSTGKHYALSVSSTSLLTIDYNDYYAPNGVLGYLGANITTLAGWKAATGQDIHSLNINPVFATPGGTLAANYLPSAAGLIAVTGTGITTDYGENIRSLISPSMGAWEYTVSPPCANPTSGGAIADNQTGCSPFDPALLTNTTSPSGHNGTLEYKWQKSTTSSSTGFTDIASSNSATYDPPAGLTATTWYKRIARVDCMVDWTGAAESNVITITVNPTGQVNQPADQVVCNSGSTTAVTFATTNSGGTTTYAWTNTTTSIGLAASGTGKRDGFYRRQDAVALFPGGRRGGFEKRPGRNRHPVWRGDDWPGWPLAP